jgi:bifunctional DNA-binding transcriptional regulator/antitoxin component of YhaV-PrlF toxin-antitoxin module
MNVATKFGPKGQVVVPKAFRDKYGFGAGKPAILVETQNGVLITAPGENLLDLCKEWKTRMKKGYKIPLHISENMAWERWKKVR